MATIDEVFAAKGIALPLESAANVEDDKRYEEGKAIMQAIYGPTIETATAGLPEEYSRVLPRLIAEYRFGDFYTRDGLDQKTRSLLDLVVAVALGASAKQIAGHAQGCISTGNTTDEVYDAVLHAMAYTGVPCAMSAFSAITDAI